MAQSVDSSNSGDVSVIINDDNSNNFAVQEGHAQVSSKEPNLYLDEKVSSESLGQQGSYSEEKISSNCSKGEGNVLLCTSSTPIRQNTSFWRTKSKPKLAEPPEQDQQVEKGARSATLGKACSTNQDDELGLNDDIPEKYWRLKLGMLALLQWVSFVLLLSALVCSLTVPVFKKRLLWDLPLWKWEVMILVLICGRLVSGWGVRLLVFFIKSNFLWKKRVLYFVYGLRKAVQNCFWLGLVLLAWEIIFNEKVEKETNSKVLRHVTKCLFCLLVGTLIWLLKTLLVKVLASSFHVNAYFERIEKAFFNQAVIKKLLMPTLVEAQCMQDEEGVAIEKQKPSSAGKAIPTRRLLTVIPLKWWRVFLCGSIRKMTGKKKTHKQGDNMSQLNAKNVSAGSMIQLINVIENDQCLLDEQTLDSDDISDGSRYKIRFENKAKEAARMIFRNVAKTNPEYIYHEDLGCFMDAYESSRFMRCFDGPANGRGIDKASFEIWMVEALTERKALKSSLKDTNTAVDDLHCLLNVIVAAIIVIIWLIIFRVAIFHFLVLTLSQIVLMAFVFGNTCKTTFEAIIFLFVMHPFDVGDRCEVDGVQMVVEEMNILTTVFLRFDFQKIIYPNSVLATKPISNYYRSPDMGDAVDFCIHISTPAQKVTIMKQKIIGYIESRSDYWYPCPMVVAVDVEDMNKLKMAVWLRHRMNHQNMVERWARRAALLEEMIKVFKELDIEYRMLPLDMNVRHIPGRSPEHHRSNWTTCAAK